MSNPTKMRFNKWLTQFCYEDSNRGKLARCIVVDHNFPHHEIMYELCFEYLEKIKAPKYIKNEYKKNWNIYRELSHVKTDDTLKNTIRPSSISKDRVEELRNFGKKPQLIDNVH